MNYSDWQIGKLVRALLGYRALKARNGRQPSWEAVRDALLLSKATLLEFPKDGSEPKIKSEALRRFAAGNQGSMESEKLDDLARFLIAEGLLSENEIANDGFLEEAIALHSRLAVSRIASSHLMTLFAPLFTAYRHGICRTERISLRVIAKPIPDLFLLEEECHFEITEPREKLKSVTFRRGYAFATTTAGRISIFLRSEDRRDSVYCLEVPLPHTSSPLEMGIVRVGGPDVGTSEQSDDECDRRLADIGFISYRFIARPVNVKTVSTTSQRP